MTSYNFIRFIEIVSENINKDSSFWRPLKNMVLDMIRKEILNINEACIFQTISNDNIDKNYIEELQKLSSDTLRRIDKCYILVLDYYRNNKILNDIDKYYISLQHIKDGNNRMKIKDFNNNILRIYVYILSYEIYNSNISNDILKREYNYFGLSDIVNATSHYDYHNKIMNKLIDFSNINYNLYDLLISLYDDILYYKKKDFNDNIEDDLKYMKRYLN